jgi:PKD repeat protein
MVSIDSVRDGMIEAVAYPAELERLREAGIQWQTVASAREPELATMCPVGWDTDPSRSWDCYPTYQQYESLMAGFAADYPNLCRLENLGATTNQVRPHSLWVLRISDNPDVEEVEPEVFYASSMHGDETTGYVLMLRLINELLTNYGTDPEITNLVDDLEIWINPLHNPDGTYYSSDTEVGGAIRSYTTSTGASGGMDPNRNFPDPEDGDHPDGNPWWAETVHMMTFAENHSITLAANFHGGIEVVNYPWDTWQRRHVDDAWLIHISRTYADAAQAASPPGYMTALNNGITNGFDWYSIAGGRQDFMTYFHGAREVTIELSDAHLLPASQLDDHWHWNRQSLLDYLGQARQGIYGVVTDYDLNPLAATIEVVGVDTEADNSFVRTDPDVGDYHRMLLPGTYTLRYSAVGHETVEVTDIPVSADMPHRMDVFLMPLPTAVVTGEVMAPGAMPLAGAVVEISDLGVSASTLADGSYTMPAIFEGQWSFRVSAGGHETVTVDRWVEGPSATLNFTLAPLATDFESDFESDDGGLTTGQGWQWGEPFGAGHPGANSGSRVWATNLSGNYSDNANWTLDLSDVAINGANAQLRFWHWYDIEQGSSDWDGGNVSIRSAGSGAFQLLTPEGGYPSDRVSALGEPGFTGTSGGWTEVVVDLGAWSGQSVDLRWRFASDSSIHMLGWYLDDISIASVDRVADFDVDPTTPTPGVPALFTDRSSGPVIGWWWDFDDGATSDAQNPNHAFASDGTYQVTLTAYYADGEASVTLPVNVGEAAAIFDDGFESGDLSAWN